MHRLLLTAALAGTLVLSACGGGAADDTAAPPRDVEQSVAFNDADVSFVSGMRPHHAQAIEMSDIVLAADPPTEVAELARAIQAAQRPEIAQLDEMLVAFGSPPAGAGHEQHGGGHLGMLTEEQLAELRAAEGNRAVRLYLEGMIAHHQGAVEAAEVELATGEHGPAKALARRIAQSQAAEIETLKTLLEQLPA